MYGSGFGDDAETTDGATVSTRHSWGICMPVLPNQHTEHAFYLSSGVGRTQRGGDRISPTQRGNGVGPVGALS
jgi:hypothetical protein